jgi:hypothetical protein
VRSRVIRAAWNVRFSLPRSPRKTSERADETECVMTGRRGARTGDHRVRPPQGKHEDLATRLHPHAQLHACPRGRLSIRPEESYIYSARHHHHPSPAQPTTPSSLPSPPDTARPCLLLPPDSCFFPFFFAAAKYRRFLSLIPHASPASPPPHVPRLHTSLDLARLDFSDPIFSPRISCLLLAPGQAASPSSLRLRLTTHHCYCYFVREGYGYPIAGPLAREDFGATTESQSYTPAPKLFSATSNRSFRRNRFCEGASSATVGVSISANARVLAAKNNAFCEDSVVKDRVLFSADSSCQTEMSALLDLLMGIFRQQTLGGAALELAALAAPLWLAALVGLLIGWAWRPRWAGVVVGDHNAQQAAQLPPPPAAAAVVPRNEAPAVVTR